MIIIAMLMGIIDGIVEGIEIIVCFTKFLVPMLLLILFYMIVQHVIEYISTNKERLKAIFMEPYFLILQIGSGLIPLVTQDKGAELLQNIRTKIVIDLGIDLHNIRILDNPTPDPYGYCITLDGAEEEQENGKIAKPLAVDVII